MDIVLKNKKTLVILSVFMAVVVAATSMGGIFFGKQAYEKEAEDYVADLVGQDIVNLAVVLPLLLIITSILFGRFIRYCKKYSERNPVG